MGLLGERPPQYFLNQVRDRQIFLAKQNRNINNNNAHDKYNATKTAWFKLASGVSMEGTDDDPIIVDRKFMKSGIKFPKKYVLFNGTSYKGKTLRKGIGYEDSYDTSDPDFGAVPMPGVVSADIKCLNRGSIKEAHIEIVCWSRRQFEIIDSLYLRLGYDMLFEWGWSNYVSSSNKISKMGSTLIDSKWFSRSGKDTDYAYWLKEIELLRKKYDGFFGKVVNFDWSFESNGSYKIKLKLITHGDVIESLTLPPSNFKNDGDVTPKVDTIFEDIIFKDKQINTCVNITYRRSTKDDESTYKVNAGYWKDALSSHLANLMFVGKGISNFIWGKHRNIESGDGKISGDALTKFDKNNKAYRIDKSKLNYSGKNGYKPREIMHTAYYKGSISADNSYTSFKSMGYGFYGRITGTFGNGQVKPQQGNVYMDSFVLYSNTFKGNNMEDKILSSESETFVRLQYLLWYIKTFCIYSLKSTGNPIVDINWNDPILMYCFPVAPYANVSNPNLKVPEVAWINKKGTNTAHSSMGSKVVLRNPNYSFTLPTHSGRDIYDLYGGKDNTMGIEKAVIFDEEVGNHIIGANIYLNLKNVLKLISSASSVKDEGKTRTLDLFSLMKNICDDINESLGGINNLAPVIDTETNTLSIQDQTNFPSNFGYHAGGIGAPDPNYFSNVDRINYSNDTATASPN